MSHADKNPKEGISPGLGMMPQGQGKSMTPPPSSLTASRNSNVDGASYAGHRNDPRSRNGELANVTEYGGRQTGQIASRGAGDTNDFSANDVNQGAVGDCYLLAALMALATTRPELLKRAITGPKSDGTYDVRIYTGASDNPDQALVPKVVNVSPHFFVISEKAKSNKMGIPASEVGEKAFARGGDRDAGGNEELWVKLIEKAFAAEAGSYEAIDGGFATHVLEALTGEQQKEFWFNGVHASTQRNTQFVMEAKLDGEQLSTFIRQTLERGMPIATSTYEENMLPKDPASIAEMERLQISELHAYAVIGATERHVTVRNPHGRQIGDAAQIELTWQQFKKYFKELSTNAKADE
jgi:hypothetical protein